MPRHRIEWPTLAIVLGCYAVWLGGSYFHNEIGLVATAVILTLATTMHSSLQHEVVHGHPTGSGPLNEATIYPAVGLYIPYRRYRLHHIQHHRNEWITDPYEDPESFYFAPGDWDGLPGWIKTIFRINQTLLGRLVIGPAVTLVGYYRSELRLMLSGDRDAINGWLHHLLGVVLALAWLVFVAKMNLLFYALAVAYPAVSLLLLRSYAEHQADRSPNRRSAIVERGGLFGLLYLNNNLHYVHHQNPGVAWYDLPALFRAHRESVLEENGNFHFRSYWSMLAQHGLRAKEPIPHPLMKAAPGDATRH